MLRGEHDKSDRLSSYALDIGAPSRAVYLISIILTCLPSHTSGSARCTLLSQADDELRWSGESAQRASMINGQCNALGGRHSLQKRKNAAQTSLSGSQAKRYSLGAHLLSIRLEQTCLHSTPRRVPTWNSGKAAAFLELKIDDDFGSEKALRSTPRNRVPEGTTASFGALDGARRRQSRKTRDLGKSVLNCFPDPSHLRVDPVCH